MARTLRVLPADAKPEPKRPVTIRTATDDSERGLLVAMRSKVACEIDAGVPAHTLAPLMRQLRELDKEIRALDAAAEQEETSGGYVPDAEFDASAV